MTTTTPKTKPQPANWFRTIVTGGSHINQRQTMKRTAILTITLIASLASSSLAAKPVDMTKRAEELKSLRWGMFICWSFSTFSGREFSHNVKDVAFFKATDVDTDQWARTAKEAGMGYILFLTKHHDGFCLWDTKTTDRNVMKAPLGRDVLAEVKKSCDKYGIKLALYFSEAEWRQPGGVDHPDFTPDEPKKIKKGGSNVEEKKAQLKELLTQYGPIEYIWFDYAAGDGGLSHKETIAWCKSFQPGCFIGFNGGDQEDADIHLGERGRPLPLASLKADSKHMKNAYLLAEFTYPILPAHKGGASWFYSLPIHDNLCHPPESLYADYLGAVKYGNIFSIDVGPDYNGKLREIDVKTLRQVGEMIRSSAPIPAQNTVTNKKTTENKTKQSTSENQQPSLFAAAPVYAKDVLVEAESFSQRGGWVVDQQFMDQMGSPYLLAHGLGRPVADATTEVAFPETGTYRVWVRTKDWVAKWKAPGTPGRFQLLVNGRALATTFGTVGAEWHWQDGGNMEITERNVRLSLHDLTGFEGRCDAILFSRDPKFTPPNAGPAMAEFRRKCLGFPEQPEPAGEYDLVVTGGGTAGTCAALSAARLGLKVALIQDRPVLGGNNSSEVRVSLRGARNKEPWPRIGDVTAELEQKKGGHAGPANKAELYEDEKKLAVVRAEPNIRLFLEHRANEVEANEGKITAVIAQEINTGRRVRIAGRWFADCTGDAAVGALAGADFEVHPKGHMGPCNLWNVCDCDDTNALNTAVSAAVEPQPFPRCPWALDLSDKPFPGRSKTKPDTNRLGVWNWESGFDRDPIAEMEYVRDYNFRAMYGAWDAMKNVDKVLPNHRLNWSAHILGKRESRRLMGDVVLCFDDLTMDRQFPDGCVPTGWSNDLHLPDPRYEKGFEGEAFISTGHFGRFPAHSAKRPYWIPYRCLYSRNIANLFMAGRDISVKHEALGAVRVMRTGGCMGEIVGMAASLCKKHDTTPRGVYEQHLSSLQDLMRRGVGKVDGRTIPNEGGRN